MHIRVLPLAGTLVIGGLLGSLALGGPQTRNVTPGIVQASGTSPGIYPTPGMGPPGAVAAYGAMVPMIAPSPAIQAAPAPLVAAKFLTAKGVQVTAFPGSPIARKFDTPTVMGLRPGYVYRFELSNIPDARGQTLFPEVELRGVLVPRPGMKYMDYPIPLMFTPADLDRALAGALITKVIYLEDPEKAIPAEASADAPIEVPENTERAAIKVANDNGRLMAIVRLGNRKPSQEELWTVAVDGTILFAGENRLKSPLLPPVFQYWGVPFFDPIAGPRGPKEECLENGGDRKDALGIGAEERLFGLNATDVGVEYTMGGKRKVTTSCPTCICAPRYIIRKAEMIPTGFDVKIGLGSTLGELRPSGFNDRIIPLANISEIKANELIGRVRPSAYVGRIGVGVFIGITKPAAVAQVSGVKVEGTYVEPEQLTAYPTLCPLTVTKQVDPPGPKQQGEIVTIVIRYANTGTKAANDIVISDSLSGRLEYIPGSSQTDRPSNFSSSENEAGSLALRWELPGTLLPGQSGTIKFKAKIR